MFATFGWLTVCRLAADLAGKHVPNPLKCAVFTEKYCQFTAEICTCLLFVESLIGEPTVE